MWTCDVLLKDLASRQQFQTGEGEKPREVFTTELSVGEGGGSVLAKHYLLTLHSPPWKISWVSVQGKISSLSSRSFSNDVFQVFSFERHSLQLL